MTQPGRNTTRQRALQLTAAQRAGQLCPICGKPMTRQDLRTAVNYGANVRPCHLACWRRTEGRA